ncbi:hypothetical protein AAHC03_013401 [Spirometra sp. Aus1]
MSTSVNTEPNTEIASEAAHQLPSKTSIRHPQLSVTKAFAAMFLTRALERILSEKETKRAANADLRNACREGITCLAARSDPPGNSSTDLKNSSGDHVPPLMLSEGPLLNDERILLPFELACKSKSPKVVAIALDSLQKLIAYGHVSNDAYDSSGKTRLIERIVATICSCFQGVNTDDEVQLQVIKALLTVITSPVVEVHERDILLVVRTCYSIYMATRNIVNQTTARATLTQMLNVIFQKMEQSALDAAVLSKQTHIDDENQNQQPAPEKSAPTEKSGHVPEVAPLTAVCNVEEVGLSVDPATHPNGDEVYNAPISGNQSDESQHTDESINDTIESEEQKTEQNQNGSPEESAADDATESLDSSSGHDNGECQTEGKDENHVPEVDDTSSEPESDSCPKLAVETSERPSTPPCASVVDSNVDSLSADAVPPPRSPVPEQLSNGDVNNSSSLDSPTDNAITPVDMDTISPGDAADSSTPGDYNFTNVVQKDAFLVFRSLCRLSVKPLSGVNPSDPKSHELRSKILSLQLLLSILQQPGPAFRSSEVFVTAIKQYLCVALSKNGVSTVPEVFELSLAIFISLLTHFKQHLKMQIEVFFKEILLSILESPSTTFEHKWIVVAALQRICTDAQCVVDAYLNYDCDLDRANIFEQLVVGLAKIAQGRNSGDLRATPAQMQELRKRGLECLVLLLRCMVQWSHDLYNGSSEAQSFLGSEPMFPGYHNIQAQDADSTSSVGLGRSTPDDPEAFESRKAQKEIYEKGISLFNHGKLQRGLSLLRENNLLGESAEDVALFLHNESRLSRTAIGDYLGENEVSALEVMYAYVDCFDFSGAEFVSALRQFLSGFRLPGEAQKIDRLMEKFAARYCACNPSNTMFASADTAYVLAYSIIMLTTDLHSSKIKQKQRMSKEDYIRMNRGINDSQDLPREYLGKIYDEIARCEIQMKTAVNASLTAAASTGALSGGGGPSIVDDAPPTTLSGSNLSGQHLDKVSREMEALAQSARELMESVSHMQSDFTSATHVEHVRPMFKLVWTPFLAAFSVGLQDCDDLSVAHLCLEGIQYAIRIACIFHMELERDAYVQALARFTLLLSTTSNGTAGAIGATGSSSGPRNRADSTASSASSTVGVGGGPTFNNAPRVLSSGLVGQAGGTGLNSVPDVAHHHATQLSGPEAMKSKNVACIRALIAVAQSDGNYLSHSWLDILRCISQLESAHVIATTTSAMTARNPQSSNRQQRTSGPTTEHNRASSPKPSAKESVTNRVAPGSLAAATVDSRKAAVLQGVMGETGSRSVVVAVDKVFSGSIRLDGDAIVDFVKALCQVSLEELALPHPRTFSLQKVVEISYYNMGRIRLQWSRVWEHIGQHFTTAGRSSNEDVAVFAVDSLRQLSVKLIEKGELPNFHFQKEFLRPFLSILDDINAVSPNIQDMVVRCVAQLIQSQWTNIRSGWANIFLVLNLAASSTEAGVVELAFDSCNFVINTVFPNNFYLLVDSFPLFVRALAEFACNLHFPDTSMEAIRLIRTCARVISERAPQFIMPASLEQHVPTATEDTANTGQDIPKSDTETDDRVWRGGWMPVLYELFRVINNCKLDVRTRGLTVFFEILKTYGSTFHLAWWNQIFKLIFSIFEHGRDPTNTPQVPHTGISRQRLFSNCELELPAISHRVFSSAADRSEWLNTTCNHALYSVVDIFTQFFDQIGNSLLSDLYRQLRWCCLQDHEQLARSGTSCLETVVLSCGARFNEEKWAGTIDLLVGLFKTTVPHELLTWRPDTAETDSQDQEEPILENGANGSPAATKRMSSRSRLFLRLLINCIVQYELIQTVDNILFFSSHSRHEDIVIASTARALSAAVNRSLLQQSVNSTSGERCLPDAVITDSPQTTDLPRVPSTPLTRTQPLNSVSDDDELVNGELPMNRRATYPYVSVENRLLLIKCLLESHRFAKAFNSNVEQRNILWEAGFKAKAKPNLLKQETHSLSTALRILFRMGDENTSAQEQVDSLLEKTIAEAVTYYRGLIVDGHRQAWDSCMLLLLVRLVNMKSQDRFDRMRRHLYSHFCDLIALPNLSPEVSVMLRAFMLRAGGGSQ